MDAVSRRRFNAVPDDQAIDVGEPLGAAPDGEASHVEDGDRGRGRTAGAITGDVARDRVYDAVDALDRNATNLASRSELAVYGAVNLTATVPAPISAAQGRRLAAAARSMAADQTLDRSGRSPWSLAGAATCRNSAIASPRYAGPDVWKCNVFVGEAFNRAGLTFPLSSVGHYASANSLASRPTSFQPVSELSHVRPGDLLTINRRGDAGHVELVTGVARDAAGNVRAITTLGAHEEGLAEGTATASPLVAAAASPAGKTGRAGWTIGAETFHVLRPLASSVPARDVVPTGALIRG